ncbi:unnamed protein product, partial [marine sediment metagenome]
MTKFWELFRSSVVLQFTLALMFGATVCYLYATGQVVPEGATTALMLILGFVFGQK